MLTKRSLTIFITAVIVMSLFIGGCSGKSERLYGLEPDAVVKTAFEAAKTKKLAAAAAYIAPDTLTGIDEAAVAKHLTGFGLADVTTANLLSVKTVSTRGNFAVVVATIHQENTLRVSMKTIGLEKLEGEWYIVPMDRIVQDAKYRLLAELLTSEY